MHKEYIAIKRLILFAAISLGSAYLSYEMPEYINSLVYFIGEKMGYAMLLSGFYLLGGKLVKITVQSFYICIGIMISVDLVYYLSCYYSHEIKEINPEKVKPYEWILWLCAALFTIKRIKNTNQ